MYKISKYFTIGIREEEGEANVKYSYQNNMLLKLLFRRNQHKC